MAHFIYYSTPVIQYSLWIMINLEKNRNMRLLLCAFEQVSSLKMIFHKSEIFFLGVAQES